MMVVLVVLLLSSIAATKMPCPRKARQQLHCAAVLLRREPSAAIVCPLGIGARLDGSMHAVPWRKSS